MPVSSEPSRFYGKNAPFLGQRGNDFRICLQYTELNRIMYFERDSDFTNIINIIAEFWLDLAKTTLDNAGMKELLPKYDHIRLSSTI